MRTAEWHGQLVTREKKTTTMTTLHPALYTAPKPDHPRTTSDQAKFNSGIELQCARLQSQWQAYKSKSIRIQDNYSDHTVNSMVKIVSTPMNSVKMVINTVVKCLGADPTDVSSAPAVNVVTSIDFLDEDTTIGTLLDVGMSLRPPLQ